MLHIKHLSAAALLCAVSLTVSADPIDLNQALQKVQKFRQSTAAPNGMRKAAVWQVRRALSRMSTQRTPQAASQPSMLSAWAAKASCWHQPTTTR
ncbi:MAG: hypothetical protein KBT12_04290 [Bacteroidales bacterium]|nr:hypothetical protein [Candidatus Physcousia equi]